MFNYCYFVLTKCLFELRKHIDVFYSNEKAFIDADDVIIKHIAYLMTSSIKNSEANLI